MESRVTLSGQSDSASRPVMLVHPTDRTHETIQTPGMIREQAVGTDRQWAGFVQTAPGMVSGWHHHGEYDSTIYVLTGALRIESGVGGREVVEAHPGDFLFIPRGTIHRESNPSSGQAESVVFRVGTGTPVVNLNGPA